VITPAKNEEKFISHAIESMLQQTLKPVKWIIVDDGSTDKTMDIIERHKRAHHWIEVVTIHNKPEKRLYGAKVIRAFYEGYKSITDVDYEFVVKMDADIKFPSHLFKEIADTFKKDEKLGLCSAILVEENSEAKPSEGYIGGFLKCVRKKCFDEIGGFAVANGWDGLDQLKAKYLGWEIKNIPVKVIHLRPTGTEYKSRQFFYNNGIAHYRLGNDLPLTLIRSLIQLKEKPFGRASLSYFRGYMSALFSRQPKLVDRGLEKYIRRAHYRKLRRLFIRNSN
jgi:glycosyltransferase involved in cell wall biosynthesis